MPVSKKLRFSKTYLFVIFLMAMASGGAAAFPPSPKGIENSENQLANSGLPNDTNEQNNPSPQTSTAPAEIFNNQTVVQASEPLKNQIDRTIERLQVQTLTQVQVMQNNDARHFVIRNEDRAYFEPEVRIVEERNRLAQEQNLAVTQAVEQSLRTLETKNLSPEQRASLSQSLERLEKSGKNESDYFQIISQIMTTANPSGHPLTDPKESKLASFTQEQASQSSASPSPGDALPAGETASGAPTAPSDAPPSFNLLESQTSTNPAGNLDPMSLFSGKGKAIPKLEKTKDPRNGAIGFGKANRLSEEGLAPGKGRATLAPKFDIPGVTAPLSIQDRAKDWIKRVVALIRGTEPQMGTEPSAHPSTLPNRTPASAETPQELSPAIEAPLITADIGILDRTGSLGAKSWALALIGLLTLYTLFKKTGLFR